MRKALILSTVAALAGLAQAVSITWSSTDGTLPSNLAATPSVTSGRIAEVSIALVGTFVSAGNANVLSMALSGGSSNVTLAARMTENSEFGAASGTNSVGTATAVSAGETVSAVAVFAHNPSQSNRIEITFYVNGAEVYTSGYNNLTSLTLSGWSNASYFTPDSIAVYDGALTAAEAAQIHTTLDALAVPEPTALALLALGVAGVALRRRAA